MSLRSQDRLCRTCAKVKLCKINLTLKKGSERQTDQELGFDEFYVDPATPDNFKGSLALDFSPIIQEAYLDLCQMRAS
jgi:hypothetical protein